jgi:hypothetical protein
MKLLVDEVQSDQVQPIGTDAEAIGVCRISWPETMAALEHRQRDDPISSEDLEQVRQQLIQSWPTCTIVEVNKP